MANYDEWNKAIAEYFVSGMPSGATVYMVVDEKSLMDISAGFEQSETDRVDWIEEFKKAVQSECVIGNTVCLRTISGYQSDGIPRCIAFLAAMILAAHHMIAEETDNEIIAQINYFTRLRQVFDLPDEDGGRPDGLSVGVEEPLWKNWNVWLIQNSWLPSAERGQSTPYKYINYPLSQALLREADKGALEHLFRHKENSGQLSRAWDRDTLGTWVRRQQFNSRHLTNLTQERDFRRCEAITDAIYDVYISIDWDEDAPQFGSSLHRTMPSRLTAQLYRLEDLFEGNINYHLYPRQPRRITAGFLKIINQDGYVCDLREHRLGWFAPLWSENPAGGVSYQVLGHSQIRELILPERGFWILIRDPEDEMSSDFAGWGTPGLGDTFLLLCKEDYSAQMEFFKDEALIEWDDVISTIDGWLEYRECMIISASWDGIIPLRQDLYDALKPSASAAISLKGGLRVPNQGGWLEGYAPQITIYAFDSSVEFKLRDASDHDNTITEEVVNTNHPISSSSLVSGDYLLEAYSFGRLAARRALRILPWDSLDCRKAELPFSVDVKTFTLQGTIIKPNATEHNEE